MSRRKRIEPGEEEEYQFVIRRKPKGGPVWLKEYQDRFREAQRSAAEETKHLSGATRVAAMNRLVSEKLTATTSRGSG